MFIKSSKPVMLKTRQGPVSLKPHQVVKLPEPLAKRLLAKAPEIRRVRVRR